MDGDETAPVVPSWVSKLGIVDRASGIEKARSSRQQLLDATGAALTGFDEAGGATTANLLLLGLAARGLGLHDASVEALEADNPFAAFALIRAYAENAATFMYAIDKPNTIDQLFGLSEHPISLSRITSHAKQSPSTRFREFGAVYDSLSAYAHPMPTSILASATNVGENGLQWSSGPAFKSDNDFLTASGWIVEFAVANADLLEDFAQSQGGNTEVVVLFGQGSSDGGRDGRAGAAHRRGR
jgi:hypothetical protein